MSTALFDPLRFDEGIAGAGSDDAAVIALLAGLARTPKRGSVPARNRPFGPVDDQCVVRA
jgi:hypothetical protein